MEHYPLQIRIVLSSRLLETPGCVATTSLYSSLLRSTISLPQTKPLCKVGGTSLPSPVCGRLAPFLFSLCWQRRYFSLLNRPHLTPQNLTAQIIRLTLYYTHYITICYKTNKRNPKTKHNCREYYRHLYENTRREVVTYRCGTGEHSLVYKPILVQLMQLLQVLQGHLSLFRTSTCQHPAMHHLGLGAQVHWNITNSH